MAGITLSNIKYSLNEIEIQDQTLNNSDVYLASLLTKVLQTHQILSVSFINSQLKGKNKNISISFNFLKKVYSKFGIGIIGSDLKIWLKHNDDLMDDSFDENDVFYTTLDQILKKDNNTFVQLKMKLKSFEGSATFGDIMDWSSNKFKYNLPFILRNSHKFELYIENDISCVKLNEVHQMNTRIDKDENAIWKLVHNNVKDLVVDSLKGLLMKIDHPVNQGTLQVCVDYGFQAIDKNFMQNNSSIFVGGGDRGIAIKGTKAAQLIGVSNFNVSSPTRSSSSSSSSSSILFNKPLSTTPYSVFPQAPPTPSKRKQFASSRSLSNNVENKIKEGYSNNQIVVILGNLDNPPLFVWDENKKSTPEQLQILTALKCEIDSEISRISFQKSFDKRSHFVRCSLDAPQEYAVV